MPFKPYIPETYASREDVYTERVDDVVYHFHGSDEVESSPKKRKRPDVFPQEEHKVMLPFRPLGDSQWPLKDDPKVEEEEYQLGSKRLAPSIPGPSTSGISQLRKARDESASPNMDGEYELIATPPEVLEASDSDSESVDFVDVTKDETDETPLLLSFRTCNKPAVGASSAQNDRIAASSESESDSEWTLV